MNRDEITITARCVKCDGISEITFPVDPCSINIECPLCKKESNIQVWQQVWVTDRDYQELHELCKNSLKIMTEDRDNLRKIKRDLETNVDDLEKKLYYLEDKYEEALLRQSKECFLTQYVLNRATTNYGLVAAISAEGGAEAWDRIQESCNEDKPDVTDREQEHG